MANYDTKRREKYQITYHNKTKNSFNASDSKDIPTPTIINNYNTEFFWAL
jgi:hypothetical protein